MGYSTMRNASLRVALFLALLASQVCAESVDVAEVDEVAPKEGGGLGAWLGKVSGLEALLDIGAKAKDSGPDGWSASRRGVVAKEAEVSGSKPLGIEPQCELPVSVAYPKGTGPCSQLEAAKAAAKKEKEELANKP